VSAIICIELGAEAGRLKKVVKQPAGPLSNKALASTIAPKVDRSIGQQQLADVKQLLPNLEEEKKRFTK